MTLWSENEQVKELYHQPVNWLITGAAGFIGSNLSEWLLKAGQQVVGLDNFSTGSQNNLDQLLQSLSTAQRQNFTFIQGDIRDLSTCQQACQGIKYVLHQAALGSVPRSIANPLDTHQVNTLGFLNMLLAARDSGVQRLVYAASSSTYGDHPDLPKVEERIGRPLSPYAVTKLVNELYADVFGRVYQLDCIGLRYFNVFGPRQSPAGAYAAVIPKWFASLLQNQPITIFGDGETSRDFCYVDNAVQANILAAITQNPDCRQQVFNVACGQNTSLNQLYQLILQNLQNLGILPTSASAVYQDFRPGDVRHSLADISKARRLLGYAPAYSVTQGLEVSTQWYLNNLVKAETSASN